MALDPRSQGRLQIFATVIVMLGIALLLTPEEVALAERHAYGLRVTARIAFAFFMLAYIARPLVQTFGTGHWLLRHRRHLGLAAALAHAVHLFYIVLYFRQTGEVIEVVTIIFGGLAYVLFALMALTSNAASMRWLGQWWSRLHTFGMHYLWIIFTQSWLGAALENPWYWPGVAVAAAGLVLRLSARRRHLTAG